jgi:hypothetical protein
MNGSVCLEKIWKNHCKVVLELHPRSPCSRLSACQITERSQVLREYPWHVYPPNGIPYPLHMQLQRRASPACSHLTTFARRRSFGARQVRLYHEACCTFQIKQVRMCTAVDKGDPHGRGNEHVPHVNFATYTLFYLSSPALADLRHVESSMHVLMRLLLHSHVPPIMVYDVYDEQNGEPETVCGPADSYPRGY